MTASISNLSNGVYQPPQRPVSAGLATPVQGVGAGSGSSGYVGSNATLASPRAPVKASGGASFSGGDSYQFSAQSAALASDAQPQASAGLQYQSSGQRGGNATLPDDARRLGAALSGGSINPAAIGGRAALQDSGGGFISLVGTGNGGPAAPQQSGSSGSGNQPELVVSDGDDASSSTPVQDASQSLVQDSGDDSEEGSGAIAEPLEDDTDTEEKERPGELTESEQELVTRLKARDIEVKNHEQAHLRAAGGLANGGANFDYQRGPDGKRYAIGGSVNIEVSPESDPEATIAKADRIKRAALAPADPSSKDRQVAARADRLKIQAQRELAEERLAQGESEGGEENTIGEDGSEESRDGLTVDAAGAEAEAETATAAEPQLYQSRGNEKVNDVFGFNQEKPVFQFSSNPSKDAAQSDLGSKPFAASEDKPVFQFKPLGGGEEKPAFQFKPLGTGEEPVFRFDPLGDGSEAPAFKFSNNPLGSSDEEQAGVALPDFQPFQIGSGPEPKPRFQIGNSPVSAEDAEAGGGPTFIRPGSAPDISSSASGSERSPITYNINGRSNSGDQRPFDSISLIA